MKKSKVIIALVMAAMFIFMVVPVATAQSIDTQSFGLDEETYELTSTLKFDAFQLETSYAIAFLKDFDRVDITPIQIVPMFNNENVLNAVCIDFQYSKDAGVRNGYIVVTTNNLEASEFSFEQGSGLNRNATVYYWGPLDMYVLKGDVCENTRSKVTLDKSELTGLILANVPKSITESEKEQKICELQQPKYVTNTVSGTDGWVSSGSGGLPFWKAGVNGGGCSHNAVALVLNWLAIYKNSGYVPTSFRTETGIKSRVVALNSNDMNCTGMAQCIKDFRTNYSSSGTPALSPVGSNTWNASKAINSIGSKNEPCIISVSNCPNFGKGNHAVVAYEYRSSGTYFVVNDGWGATGVWLSPSYFYDLMTIS